jgi:hypothetical protein
MMGLTVKDTGGGGSFTPVPPGMHLARCYRVIDMGTQTTTWQGKEKQQAKVMLQFEVHSEDVDGKALVTDKGEPLSISKNFTASLGEKAALRAELENWRSRGFTADELAGFQLKNILGAWAMLSIVKEKGNDGKEYTNITSINPVPASMKKAGLPEGRNELKIFDIDNPDMALFDTFGQRMREKIEASPEWQQRGSPASSSGGSKFEDMSDDIPF